MASDRCWPIPLDFGCRPSRADGKNDRALRWNAGHCSAGRNALAKRKRRKCRSHGSCLSIRTSSHCGIYGWLSSVVCLSQIGGCCTCDTGWQRACGWSAWRLYNCCCDVCIKDECCRSILNRDCLIAVKVEDLAGLLKGLTVVYRLKCNNTGDGWRWTLTGWSHCIRNKSTCNLRLATDECGT